MIRGVPRMIENKMDSKDPHVRVGSADGVGVIKHS
jgi:hypothetical protein